MSASPEFNDPFVWFSRWLDQASAQVQANPNAMSVASVGPGGQPSIRQVLLKDFGPQGFVFYTNYHSRKAAEIDAHPAVALLWYWRGIERQIRVEGLARRVDPATSDAYFATRSRPSQLGAWASLQSQALPTPNALGERMAHFEAKFRDKPVPRPAHWGGYCVVPTRIEFWQGALHRLHFRWVFARQTPDEPWEISQIFP